MSGRGEQSKAGSTWEDTVETVPCKQRSFHSLRPACAHCLESVGAPSFLFLLVFAETMLPTSCLCSHNLLHTLIYPCIIIPWGPITTYLYSYLPYLLSIHLNYPLLSHTAMMRKESFFIFLLAVWLPVTDPGPYLMTVRINSAISPRP